MKSKKEKKELYIGKYPAKEYAPIVFFFSIVAAISIVLSAVENPNFFVVGSTIYLLIVFFLYHYSNHEEIQHKDSEIVDLKQEIRRLESIRESNENIIALNENIIALLENELEKARGNSH